MSTHSTAPAEKEVFPRHSASEAPVRRSDRIAFQIWVWSVFLVIFSALVLYLVDKLIL